MRFLGAIIAVLALTASAPTLASDYSTDRHFTQGSAAVARTPEARPAADAAKAARPCDCSCARRTGEERPAPSRVEPGRH